MSLTQIEKKGKGGKAQLMDLVREKAIQHPHIYVFRVDNMRNVVFKMLRSAFGSKGRFLIGKNKVMSLALGRDPASEVVTGASQIGSLLTGDVGLLLTDLDLVQVREIIDSLQAQDYARTGAIADMSVVVCPTPPEDTAGIRNFDTGEPISATAEVQLRQAGMPTKLKGGAVILTTDQDYQICKEGDRLTADQSRLLKLMGVRMANFAVHLQAHLHDGVLEEL